MLPDGILTLTQKDATYQHTNPNPNSFRWLPSLRRRLPSGERLTSYYLDCDKRSAQLKRRKTLSYHLIRCPWKTDHRKKLWKALASRLSSQLSIRRRRLRDMSWCHRNMIRLRHWRTALRCKRCVWVRKFYLPLSSSSGSGSYYNCLIRGFESQRKSLISKGWSTYVLTEKMMSFPLGNVLSNHLVMYCQIPCNVLSDP